MVLYQILFLAAGVNGEYNLTGLNAVCIHQVHLRKGNRCFCKMVPDSFYQHSMNQSSPYPLFNSTFPSRINLFLFRHFLAYAKKVKSYRKSTHSLSCLWKSSIFQQYAAGCPSYWWEGGSCWNRAKMGMLFQEPFMLRSLAGVTCQGAQCEAVLGNVLHNYSPGCQISCQLLCCVSRGPQEQSMGANIALS